MEYKITHYNQKKPIMVRSHERRVVRPYTKGGSWHARLKRWIWSWLRMPVVYSLMATIFVSFVASAFFGGELWEIYHPTAEAMAETILLTQKTQIPPILLRIAKAETDDNQTCDDDAIKHHFCTMGDYGNVLVTVNSNKSTDTGEFAINNYAWGAQAVKEGDDIYTEQGNQAFAIWLFYNYGTSPWSDSSSRWDK